MSTHLCGPSCDEDFEPGGIMSPAPKPERPSNPKRFEDVMLAAFEAGAEFGRRRTFARGARVERAFQVWYDETFHGGPTT